MMTGYDQPGDGAPAPGVDTAAWISPNLKTSDYYGKYK